jgi:hypothetical protein
LCSTLLVFVCAPVAAHGQQRELHWEALEVDARLDAVGTLHVNETHRMVFTGDWNGGERTFNLRPSHRLTLVSVDRVDPVTGDRRALAADAALDQVDEYSMVDGRTLRWRSRLPSDKPFANAQLTYVIRYELSRILLLDDGLHRLDHDFAFPDRAGDITRYSLQLALDPVWQPTSTMENRYTAGPLGPGEGFVLNLPLRYAGTGSPVAVDTRRSFATTAAALIILGVTALIVAYYFVRESKRGRFTPISRHQVDEDWIVQNVLTVPAEVVGAIWDGEVDGPEVAALIARMVAEGTLASETSDHGSLVLTLLVDRTSLQGYERTLVDGLFFDGGTVTSTALLRAHYQKSGFSPALLIAPELKTRVAQFAPREGRSWVPWVVSAVLLLGLFAMLDYEQRWNGSDYRVFFGIVAFGFGLFGWIPGLVFRRRMNWGAIAAGLCLLPALLVVAMIVATLWFFVTPDEGDLSIAVLAAVAILAAWVVHYSTSSLNSRESAAGIALRKKLTAGRQYFKSQLQTADPALQDSWYPWVMAYGLGGEADRWSTRHPDSGSRRLSRSPARSTSPGWTGFGGGRSGGAGAGASWAAAVGGIAAGVSSPGSRGGSGRSGGGGGGRSGGGGGGGW